MKIDGDEAFGVCVMSLAALALAARAIFGNVIVDPAPSIPAYLERAVAPIEKTKQLASCTNDNTHLPLESLVRKILSKNPPTP